jgi:mRNA interferase HicA
MKYNDLIKMLKKDGWETISQRGSHMKMVHPTKPNKLIVPNHGSKEVKKGLLKSILKDADIKTNKG